MATHTQARQWAHDGFVSIFNREPTLLEVQFVQAVAWLESNYGAGWKGAGIGSWNMGAVQSGHAPCNPATSFEYTDSHPNPDGTSTKYTICFRKYPGPVEGMADVARILYKQMKIDPSSIAAVSSQMYDKHYYEGFGATREVRIAGHVKRLTQGLQAITTSLSEPMPPSGGVAESPIPKPPKIPTIPDLALDGPLSVYLELLLSALESDADHHRFPIFGHDTDSIVRQFQESRGLKVDGDVGRLTAGAIRKELVES